MSAPGAYRSVRPPTRMPVQKCVKGTKRSELSLKSRARVCRTHPCTPVYATANTGNLHESSLRHTRVNAIHKHFPNGRSGTLSLIILAASRALSVSIPGTGQMAASAVLAAAPPQHHETVCKTPAASNCCTRNTRPPSSPGQHTL